MKHILIFFILLSLSCVCQNSKQTATEEGVEIAEIYVMPDIPGVISDPNEQATWVARHFWDNYDFADTANIYRAEYTRQAFVNYIQVLPSIALEQGRESLAALFQKAAANKELFVQLSEAADKYLYDPNSPYRNDELYITVLEAVLANPDLDQWERIRPQEQLRMSLKNRVGTPAADFRYTTASGRSGTLYGIKAPYTLIFINNPGCPACREIQERMMDSQFLVDLIAKGTVAVLAIYPDEDLDAWRKYAPQIPSKWINSYDKTLDIRRRELYDLKAIPTLYLLDKNKIVLQKDVVRIPFDIEQTIADDENN